MTSTQALAGLVAIAGLATACALDPTSLRPRPAELSGQGWAETTSRHVWAVVPEPPRWKKDVTPDKIKGTAVVIGQGEFLVACSLVADASGVGLARVNKYYVASLVRRTDDGACLLAAPDAPVNLPSWRRARPDAARAERVILLSANGVRDISARTATLFGGALRSGSSPVSSPAVAFDRFGAIIGLALPNDDGSGRLIGSEALRSSALARLDLEVPIGNDRPDEQFNVVAAPEIAPPEPRPTSLARSAETERQGNDDATAPDGRPSDLAETAATEPADNKPSAPGRPSADDARSGKSGPSKDAKRDDRRDRDDRGKRGRERAENDRRDGDARQNRRDREGRRGRRGDDDD